MRYWVANLMLFTIFPVMHLMAAPVPAPSAVLDIGPPAKGETAEQHRKREIDYLSLPDNLVARRAWRDPEVSRLPSVAASKPPRVFSWLSENVRVTPEGKGNRFRLTFRAGSRAEQVAILNTFLRIYMRKQTDSRKMIERSLQKIEDALPRLKKLAATEVDPIQRARYQQDLESAPSDIAELRSKIARYKQISVIKWAK